MVSMQLNNYIFTYVLVIDQILGSRAYQSRSSSVASRFHSALPITSGDDLMDFQEGEDKMSD